MLNRRTIEPIYKARVKSRKTVGPLVEGDTYELAGICNRAYRYLIYVDGWKVSYPMEYFYYLGQAKIKE